MSRPKGGKCFAPLLCPFPFNLLCTTDLKLLCNVFVETYRRYRGSKGRPPENVAVGGWSGCPDVDLGKNDADELWTTGAMQGWTFRLLQVRARERALGVLLSHFAFLTYIAPKFCLSARENHHV